MTNSIRPIVAASLQPNGEAQLTPALPCFVGGTRSSERFRRYVRLWNTGQAVGATEGDWRRNGRKIRYMKQ